MVPGSAARGWGWGAGSVGPKQEVGVASKDFSGHTGQVMHVPTWQIRGGWKKISESLRYRLSWSFSVIQWRNIQHTIALELSCLHSLHLGLAGHWGRGHRFTQALLARAGHAEQLGARHGRSVCSTRATSSSVLELQKEAEPYWWTQHEEEIPALLQEKVSGGIQSMTSP